MVPHCSTNWGWECLTLLRRQEAVLSSWYCCSCQNSFPITITCYWLQETSNDAHLIVTINISSYSLWLSRYLFFIFLKCNKSNSKCVGICSFSTTLLYLISNSPHQYPTGSLTAFGKSSLGCSVYQLKYQIMFHGEYWLCRMQKNSHNIPTYLANFPWHFMKFPFPLNRSCILLLQLVI